MKTLFTSLIAFLILTAATSTEAQTIVDFEELTVFDATLAAPSGFQLLGAGDVFNGFAAGANVGGFDSQGVFFNSAETAAGFSYSRFVNTTTPGFTNQFAAFPGGGSDGAGNAIAGQNYGVVFTGSSTLPDGTPTNGASLVFDNSANLDSIDIANTTFTTQYFLNGFDGFDPEPNPLQQFTAEGDFLSLIIEGFDADGNLTGSSTNDLARFTSGNLEFIDQWQTIDLDGFDNTQSLSFSLASNDFDSTFGLNIPAYVAIDNLQFVAVPEPNAACALFCCVLAMATTRFKRA